MNKITNTSRATTITTTTMIASRTVNWTLIYLTPIWTTTKMKTTRTIYSTTTNYYNRSFKEVQGNSINVSRVFQEKLECFKGALSRMFQVSWVSRVKEVQWLLQGSLKGVSRKFQGCFESDSRKFQGSLKGNLSVSMMFWIQSN